MTINRGWFQFSLRRLLILITVFAILLAWAVKRAHQRGNAIHALQELGGSVFYDDGFDETVYSYRVEPEPSNDHFWLDLKSKPVEIQLLNPLNVDIGSNLSDIYGTDTIRLWRATDADLQFLESSDARTIMLLEADKVTKEAVNVLQLKLPNTKIYVRTRNPPPGSGLGS